MLRIATVFAFLFSTVLVATPAFAKANDTQVLDTRHFQQSEFDVWGWAWYTCIENSADSCGFNKVRVRGQLETPSPIDMFIDVEFAHFEEKGANELQELWLSYTTDGALIEKVRFGRVFLAAAYVTDAPPNHKTARYPRTPEAPYGTGVQFAGSLSENWSFVADVTSLPGTSFDDPRQYDGVSFSVRSVRSFENGTFAVSTQQSEDFNRYAIDVSYDVRPDFQIKGLVYQTDEGDYDQHGGYVFAGFMATDWLELHSQVDYNSHQDSAIWTNGVRIMTSSDHVWLIVDYESSDSLDDRLVARLQTKF